MPFRLPILAFLGTIAAVVFVSEEANGAVSFQNEVMPVLSRAGCNQGACHGNLNGKGGFKLSLRGESPAQDRLTITRDLAGRRVNPLRPEESLLLQKAIGHQSHEGGVRFSKESPEYRILRDWIRAGCPDDPAGLPRILRLDVSPRRLVLRAPMDHVTIQVKGTFSDGSTRDLKELAVFEPTAANIVSISPTGDVQRLQDGEVVILVRYLDQQIPVQLAFIPPRDAFEWKETAASHPNRPTD